MYEAQARGGRVRTEADCIVVQQHRQQCHVICCLILQMEIMQLLVALILLGTSVLFDQVRLFQHLPESLFRGQPCLSSLQTAFVTRGTPDIGSLHSPYTTHAPPATVTNGRQLCEPRFSFE